MNIQLKLKQITKPSIVACTILCTVLLQSVFAQESEFDIASPPTVSSQPTNPAPVTKSTNATPTSEKVETASDSSADSDSTVDRVFGTAKVTEHKRDNGQTYSIEIEHSPGNKQYIEENDADGLSNTKTKDIDETPNIAKWRLGSW